MELQKATAKRLQPSVRYEYQKEFLNTVTKVFVTSVSAGKTQKFADMLSVELPVFVVKPLYFELAEAVQPKLSIGNAFSSEAWIRLVESIGYYARLLNTYPVNNLVEPKGLAVTDFESLVTIVRNVVFQAFGESLNRAYIFYSVINQATDVGFNNEMSAVVISDVTEEEKAGLVETLFPGQPSFFLEIGAKDEPDRSMILKAYQKIYKKLWHVKNKSEQAEEVPVETEQTNNEVTKGE